MAFKRALAADGYTLVTPILVNESDTPESVRTSIKNQWENDTSGTLKTVLLLGRVPVKYSGSWDVPNGQFPPDSHPDHGGAWPADAYYGFMGTWTANSLAASATADGGRNTNLGLDGSGQPLDNKFDAKEIPGSMDLAVGRVDFKNLTGQSGRQIPSTEAELMAQYFSKNINYRNGLFRSAIAQNQAAVADFIDDENTYLSGGNLDRGKALSSTAWATFANYTANNGISGLAATAGIEPIYSYFGSSKAFFNEASDPNYLGYLWSAVVGTSDAFDAVGNIIQNGTTTYLVGETKDWSDFNVRSVFVLVGGSYIGDWDSSSGKPNFMRGVLASKDFTLASAWVGRPHWVLHHMNMGETIGYSTLITQNDGGTGRPTLYPGAEPTGFVRLKARGDSGMKVPGLADTVWPVSESNCIGAITPGGEQLEEKFQAVTTRRK